MTQYHYLVDGMSCAACAARITRTARGVCGVREANVNLLRKTALIEADETVFDEAALFKAVREAGYGLRRPGEEKKVNRIPRMLSADLVQTILFAIALFVAAFFGGSFGLAPESIALLEAVLALAVLLANRSHWLSGIRAIFSRSPTMDSLVAMGSTASFLYSLAVLINAEVSSAGVTAETLEDLYFDSSAMIYAFVGIGKWLEGRAKDKSVAALEGLAQSLPQKAVRLRNGVEESIEASEILVGDTLVVRAGEAVPADGKILSGEAEVDESILTGESLPRLKKTRDEVSCATKVTSGWFRMRVTEAGSETRFSKILALVDAVSESKAPIERIADKVSALFVPFVFFVAVATFCLWIALGRSVEFSLVSAVCVLVISCPCALGLATPVAVTIGSTLAAQQGVFFKNAQAIEELSRVDTVVFDKTGTLTEGEFEVVSLLSETPKEALSFALTVESFSTHPLAKAICRYAKKKGYRPLNAENYKAEIGLVSATVDGKHVAIGNARALGIASEVKTKKKYLYDAQNTLGHTRLYVAVDGKIIARFDLADKLRSGAASLISHLKAHKIQTIAASGDAKGVLAFVKKRLGLNESFGAMTPEGKQVLISKLKGEKHHVLFVGDGINDAPSLVEADVGMAVGAGTDVAVDSADVILVSNRIPDIGAAIELSHALMRNIHQNLFWAFFYNVLGIPLAAGFLYPVTGWQLSPMFAAAAMSLSSICVVSNELRLFTWSPGPLESDDIDRSYSDDLSLQEKETMQYSVRIEGMACEHCARAVTKALSALSGVEEVKVDLAQKCAFVEAEKPLIEEEVRKAIEAEDFTYIQMKTL